VLGDGETALNNEESLENKSLGRKRDCPGFDYDWTVLERAGNALRPTKGARVPHEKYDDFFLRSPGGKIRDASPAAIMALKTTLTALGYLAMVDLTPRYDNVLERAIEAFQGRYFSGPARSSELLAVRDGLDPWRTWLA
jgi:hypothetical protein